MSDADWLSGEFDGNRARLRAVAYRMLGSGSEADDAVQEAWIKMSRAGAYGVENLGGWMTTVVARVCLDMLRTRRSRREEALAPAAEASGGQDPGADVALADAIGPALLVVLELLAPAERVAFVLHDMFDLSFDEIGPIVERSPAAARQLASRARRRVRGAAAPPSAVAERRAVVGAFLAASREGDFDRLIALLAPDVVLRADELAVRTAAARPGAPAIVPELRGATAAAHAFKGRAAGARPVLIDGAPGAVWAQGGQVRAAFLFEIEDGRITGIDLLMDPDSLADLDVQ